jgi:hypothetical protein
MNTYTAFDGPSLIAQGCLSDVVLKIKKKIGKLAHTNILVFSDTTGKVMDFNFQGSDSDVQKRLDIFTSAEGSAKTEGPGRPKLGVISREVSLLPRHWEWLANQKGASATLRLLIEDAMKKSSSGSEIKLAQERTYKFMSAVAGDFINYEEALRALYKRDAKLFFSKIEDWPRDLKKHIDRLSKAAFLKS